MLPIGDQHSLEVILLIGLAYALALPLGWERKTQGDAGIGLRTLPLVAVGSCGYVLISNYLREGGVYTADGVSRTLRSVMTGIGFIGGGAILKQSKSVAGIATGASVWTTGAIGVCVAAREYAAAVALTLTHVLVVDVTGWLAKRLRGHSRNLETSAAET